jgi:hypothetical protein
MYICDTLYYMYICDTLYTYQPRDLIIHWIETSA